MVEARATESDTVPPPRGGVGSSDESRQWRPGSFALRDAWFPLIHTPEVGDRAVRREIHQQPYYFWRESGQIKAAEFRPEDLAMRGRDATEFTAGTGTYTVVERYGYAWVWYGNPANADPALLPDVPYLSRERKLPRHFWGTVTFDCTYELTCENLLDLTHADFLHSKLIGDSLSENDQISVESTSETVTMIREAKGRRTAPAQRGIITWSKYQDLLAVTHIHLRSGVTVLHGRFTPGISVRLFHPDIPVSPTCTKNNYTFNPRHCNSLVRNIFPFVAPVIARQDNSMLKPQNRRYLEGCDRVDFSSRFDEAEKRRLLIPVGLRSGRRYLEDSAGRAGGLNCGAAIDVIAREERLEVYSSTGVNGSCATSP
jgi:hypothetical protein